MLFLRHIMICIVFLVFMCAIINGKEEELKDLVVAGIFPVTGTGGWAGGQGCLPAALMAFEDVNKISNLLPGYRLTLHWNDSECEPGLGTSVLYDLLYNPPQKIMLLGAGCSTVSTTVAEAARMWNLIVLSYGSSSPALSNRERFPTFFRTHPPATLQNPTRVKLLKKFGWKKIAILQEAQEVFISTVEDMEIVFKEAGLEIITRQSFLTDPTDAVKNLKRQDARIIVGVFYEKPARKVFCEVYKQKLFGKKYVWYIIGWYANNWYANPEPDEHINCTVEQMKEALQGHFTTEAVMLNRDDKVTIANITSEQFLERLHNHTKGRTPQQIPGYAEAPLAYDAVWAIALAFNQTLKKLAKRNKTLLDFDYNNKEIADELYSAMNSTKFFGVSGMVAFSAKGDRIALSQIEQMIDGEYNLIGYYDSQTDNLTWYGMEQWIGGKPPPDHTMVQESLRTISKGLFIGMCSVSAVGIVCAIICLTFNFVNKRKRPIRTVRDWFPWGPDNTEKKIQKYRFIRLSHPDTNNIILCGITVCLISIVFLGLDGQFVEKETYPYVCQARAWLLSLGFSLAYGAMFSKIWRVHRLTTKAKKDSKVQGWKLYIVVVALCVIDIIILSVWQAIDPLQRDIERFPPEKPLDTEEDINILPLLEHCKSEHNTVWLSVMYGYKGLLLIFGIFLAYETRNIKIKQLNDSKYVGMSIYNVVVLCMITAPVTLIISSQQNASFAFVAIAIIFCSFLSMASIFIPKFLEIRRTPHDSSESKSLTDSIPSKEEEERHQKLIAENEEIKRQIAEKEEKISILNQKLQEKGAMRAKIALGEVAFPSSNLLVNTQPSKKSPVVTIVAPMATPEDTIAPDCDSALPSSSITKTSKASTSEIDFSESYL